jgi:hypothetical protein
MNRQSMDEKTREEASVWLARLDRGLREHEGTSRSAPRMITASCTRLAFASRNVMTSTLGYPLRFDTSASVVFPESDVLRARLQPRTVSPTAGLASHTLRHEPGEFSREVRTCNVRTVRPLSSNRR